MSRPRGLTSGLIHVDVVSVSPILLPQGVGHPAALRVTLLTLPGLLGGAEPTCLVGLTQQLQVLALHTAVLPEGALVEFQALGTRAVEEPPRERVCKRA